MYIHLDSCRVSSFSGPFLNTFIIFILTRYMIFFVWLVRSWIKKKQFHMLFLILVLDLDFFVFVYMLLYFGLACLIMNKKLKNLFFIDYAFVKLGALSQI